MVTSTKAATESELAARIRAVKLLVFDFDGVFTDNGVWVFEDGREAVRCNRSDGIGLSKLRKIGLDMMIISTETNPVVTARSRKLKLRCIQGSEDKRATLDEVAAELNLALDQVAYVGNDVNDLPCLTVVGLPMIVADAHPDVYPFALYRTKINGGHGAVREICDMFADVLGTE